MARELSSDEIRVLSLPSGDHWATLKRPDPAIWPSTDQCGTPSVVFRVRVPAPVTKAKALEIARKSLATKKHKFLKVALKNLVVLDDGDPSSYQIWDARNKRQKAQEVLSPDGDLLEVMCVTVTYEHTSAPPEEETDESELDLSFFG